MRGLELGRPGMGGHGHGLCWSQFTGPFDSFNGKTGWSVLAGQMARGNVRGGELEIGI